MTRPRLLDLFSCAGGAARGYHDAGFDVTGVDQAAQPRYPYAFVQADVLSLDPHWIASFDAIHASPPCQAHSRMRHMPTAKDHLDLIAPTRAMLQASGRPWAMENVVGAPLIDPVTLCGTMFGLGVADAELQRHRLFEFSRRPVLVPMCNHGGSVIGVYGGHVRNRKRVIGVYGNGPHNAARKKDKGQPDFTMQDGKTAMGIDWMTRDEMSQAIPPAYTRWVGQHLMEQL